MTRRELTHAVARATGESAHLIRERGFSLIDAGQPCDPESSAGLGLTCPGCGADVQLVAVGSDPLPEFAECGRCDAVYAWDEDEVDLLESLPAAACA